MDLIRIDDIAADRTFPRKPHGFHKLVSDPPAGSCLSFYGGRVRARETKQHPRSLITPLLRPGSPPICADLPQRAGRGRGGQEAKICSFQVLALRSPQCRQDPCLFAVDRQERHGSCSFIAIAKKERLRDSQGGGPPLSGYGMRFPAALYSPYHSARVRGRAEPAQLSSMWAGLVVPSTT